MHRLFSYKQVLRSQENVSQTTSGVAFAHPGMVKSSTTIKVAPPEAPAPAPSPPKAPRSAFMCFTDVKKQEIMNRYGLTEVCFPGRQFHKKSTENSPCFSSVIRVGGRRVPQAGGEGMEGSFQH
jgi:hypothetical protein